MKLISKEVLKVPHTFSFCIWIAEGWGMAVVKRSDPGKSIFGFSSVAALLILMKIIKGCPQIDCFYLGYSKGCAWWKYKGQIRQNSILDFSATTVLILMKLDSKQVIISTNVNTRPILAPLGTHFVTSMSPILKI